MSRFIGEPVLRSFVLTNIAGKLVYGFSATNYLRCRRKKLSRVLKSLSANTPAIETVYVPRCVCVLSTLPLHQVFQDLVCAAASSGGRIFGEDTVKQIAASLSAPLPSPGGTLLVALNNFAERVPWPTASSLPLFNLDVRPLFRSLDPDNIVSVLEALLTEQQIVVVSSCYCPLTPVCDALRSFLYPFTWPFPFIPLLPDSLTDLLHAPTPFLFGVHRSVLRTAFPSPIVVVVDLDRNLVGRAGTPDMQDLFGSSLVGHADSPDQPPVDPLPAVLKARLVSQIEQFVNTINGSPEMPAAEGPVLHTYQQNRSHTPNTASSGEFAFVADMSSATDSCGSSSDEQPPAIAHRHQCHVPTSNSSPPLLSTQPTQAKQQPQVRPNPQLPPSLAPSPPLLPTQPTQATRVHHPQVRPKPQLPPSLVPTGAVSSASAVCVSSGAASAESSCSADSVPDPSAQPSKSLLERVLDPSPELFVTPPRSRSLSASLPPPATFLSPGLSTPLRSQPLSTSLPPASTSVSPALSTPTRSPPLESPAFVSTPPSPPLSATLPGTTPPPPSSATLPATTDTPMSTPDSATSSCDSQQPVSTPPATAGVGRPAASVGQPGRSSTCTPGGGSRAAQKAGRSETPTARKKHKRPVPIDTQLTRSGVVSGPHILSPTPRAVRGRRRSLCSLDAATLHTELAHRQFARAKLGAQTPSGDAGEGALSGGDYSDDSDGDHLSATAAAVTLGPARPTSRKGSPLRPKGARMFYTARRLRLIVQKATRDAAGRATAETRRSRSLGSSPVGTPFGLSEVAPTPVGARYPVPVTPSSYDWSLSPYTTAAMGRSSLLSPRAAHPGSGGSPRTPYSASPRFRLSAPSLPPLEEDACAVQQDVMTPEEQIPAVCTMLAAIPCPPASIQVNHLRRAFRALFVSLFCSYRRYLVPSPAGPDESGDADFDSAAFLSEVKKRDVVFLTSFVESQIFTCFTQEAIAGCFTGSSFERACSLHERRSRYKQQSQAFKHHSGPLRVGRWHGSKKCWAVLEGPFLRFFVKEDAKTAVLPEVFLVSPQTRVTVSEASEAEKGYAFTVSVPGRTMQLWAPSLGDRKIWVQLIASRRLSKSPSHSPAPEASSPCTPGTPSVTHPSLSRMASDPLLRGSPSLSPAPVRTTNTTSGPSTESFSFSVLQVPVSAGSGQALDGCFAGYQSHLQSSQQPQSSPMKSLFSTSSRRRKHKSVPNLPPLRPGEDTSSTKSLLRPPPRAVI